MKKKQTEREIEWVNVHDDDLMIKLGIRLPHYEEPDFSKTPKEKKVINKIRTKHDKFYAVDSTPYHYMPLFDKLIVYTNRKNRHSTYSFKCNVDEIQSILMNLFDDKSVIKYYFNGKTYKV